MPRYAYTVKDATGKAVTGVEEAADKEIIITKLQRQGYFIVNIEPYMTPDEKKKTSGQVATRKFTHNKVILEDLLILCRQLATMLDSGVNLIRGLDVILMQVDGKQLYDTLTQVKRDVEQGISFSASIAKHPKVFNQLWISLVEVGEAAGTMPTVLEKLAFYLEREQAFRSSILSAILYPVILLIVAFGAIIFFALVIGPKFKALFKSFNVQLPLITSVLLNIFAFISSKFIFIIVGIFAIIFVIRNYAKTAQGQKKIEEILFTLPKFGYVFKTIVVERFTSQMSILVDSGVPILYALDITQRMIGNKTCELIINDIKNKVREGKLIADPMQKSGFFPPMTVQMIAIGEETGELGKMLKKIAEYYQTYVEIFMKRFGTIFEPIMLIFMGFTIGIIVVAMFLPIFSIAQIGTGG